MSARSILICFVASFLFLSAEVNAQSGLVNLKGHAIKDELLVEILNNSFVKELEPPRPVSSPYFLRLYWIGEFGTCAPEVEKEVTCSIRYYLAASDGSMGVPGAVYFLGEVGEITEINWLESDDRDFARLRLKISNFPESAFEMNPKLKRKLKVVEIDVNLESLKVRDFK